MIIGKFVGSLDEREFSDLLGECAFRLRKAERHAEAEAVSSAAHRTERDYLASLPALNEEEIRLASTMNTASRIQAIKAYRARTDSSLWDAKTLVDKVSFSR